MMKNEKMFLSRINGCNEHVADVLRWAQTKIPPGEYMRIDVVLYSILTKKLPKKGDSIGAKLNTMLVENPGDSVLDGLYSLYDMYEGDMGEYEKFDVTLKRIIADWYEKESESER